jgi:microcystin-dependent protein
MSQHDFNIANQSFPATRTDLNNALLALASNSSGDAEPGTTYANQWWYETDTNKLKIRNEADNAWIEIATLDQSSNNVLSITTQGFTLGATAITASGTEINLLNDLTRGSIIYGNASGVTSELVKGSANTVLTSDGTDISWAAAGGGVPAGSVIYHAANTPPTDFIKANGAAISRTTYSDLFTAIGTTFGVGDGSSTFNVPDLRGEFMRGWDDSRGIDSGRSFGSAQADEFESHTHSLTGNTSITAASSNVGGVGGTTYIYSSPTGATGGSETRPRNIALLACIKY